MWDTVEHEPEEVAELLAEGAVQLVDVREEQELPSGVIAGALHVPMARLSEAWEQLDPARPVVFYCHVGARSAIATEAFRRAGWDARNLAGGVVEWLRRGLPLAAPDEALVRPGQETL